MPQTRSQTLSEAELEILTDKLAAQEKRLREQREQLHTELEFERERIRKEEAEKTEDLCKTIEDLRARVNEFESRISPSPMPQVSSYDHELHALRSELRNLREHTVASQGKLNVDSGISIRDALENVPIFDGNNISILQFGRACRRALDLISSCDESKLVRAIRSKIQGRAYIAIEDETHNTIDNLLESLRRKFSPLKHSSYYRGLLSDIYKYPNEHTLDYIGRIKDLRTAIQDGERQEGKPIDPELETFILRCFVTGLSAEHKILLKLEGYSGLQDAFSKAIIIANDLQQEKERAKPKPQPLFNRVTVPLPSNLNVAPKPFVNQRETQGNLPRPPITCSICNRFGHSANQCYRNHPSTSTALTKPKFCEFCLRYNHDITECRSYKFQKEQGNSLSPSSTNARREQGPRERSTHIIEHQIETNPEPEK